MILRSISSHISVNTAFALINITVSVDQTVHVGDNVTLRCHYTGVTSSNSLVVKWTYRAIGHKGRTSIWTYDGSEGEDFIFTGLAESKFIKIESDIKKEHTIMLRNASLSDAGNYTCTVEYFSSNYQQASQDAMVVISKLSMESKLI